MDPDVEIMFYVKQSQYLPKDKMVAYLKLDFNRKTLPKDLEESIDKVWKHRVDINSKLYNGTKFRIDSVTENENECLTINLGVTCYKEYLGTNWSPNPKLLQNYGFEKYENQQACLSDPLGVGSLVVTSDKHVIFLRRSKHCGEAPGLWDLPGGHAEPEELVGKKCFEDIDLNSMEPTSVVKEIYYSIIREIRDEVNIPEDNLSEPKLIGIARNTTSASRPSMEFLVECSKTSSEVRTLYKQGSQAEAEESTNIMVIELSRIIQMEETEKELWNNLAPSAKGCLILYRLANNVYDVTKV